MLLFVAGWSDGARVEAARARSALGDVASALPFFDGREVRGWTAPSGRAGLAWVGHDGAELG
nr:hypothetical protein [Actinomycetota bacterium]